MEERRGHLLRSWADGLSALRRTRNGSAGSGLIVDVHVDRSVSRYVLSADPPVTILVVGCAYVEVAFAIVVLADQMEVETIWAAGNGLGLCKGGSGQ